MRCSGESILKPISNQPIHRVPVRPGAIALVDPCDAALAREYEWRRGGTGDRYAVALIRNGNSLTTVYLHRLIMGAVPGDLVDHIDGNPMNCCRANLRLVDRSENASNIRETANSTCYRNVAWHKKRNRYQARVQRQGGSFRGPFRKDAAEAARDADMLLRGIFPGICRLNFPDGDELPILRKNDAGDSHA
ncbi:MAG: HNH endonuclease [Alphaproteobacteria bacterium]|nr:HNH endonuclease [Alphaproteobacteria bacterium]